MTTLADLQFKLENMRIVDEILNDGARQIEPASFLDLLVKGSAEYNALSVAIHNLFLGNRVPLSHVPEIVTVNLPVMGVLLREAVAIVNGAEPGQWIEV